MTVYLYYSRTAYRHNPILRHLTLYIYICILREKKNIWGYLYASTELLKFRLIAKKLIRFSKNVLTVSEIEAFTLQFVCIFMIIRQI